MFLRNEEYKWQSNAPCEKKTSFIDLHLASIEHIAIFSIDLVEVKLGLGHEIIFPYNTLDLDNNIHISGKCFILCYSKSAQNIFFPHKHFLYFLLP